MSIKIIVSHRAVRYDDIYPYIFFVIWTTLCVLPHGTDEGRQENCMKATQPNMEESERDTERGKKRGAKRGTASVTWMCLGMMIFIHEYFIFCCKLNWKFAQRF